MQNLQVFQNDQFGEVRTFTDEQGNPFFCLVDVCKILDISNTSYCKSTLDEDGVRSTRVTDKLNRPQNTTFIDEGNLYQVVFQSRKPEAKKFKRWVTRDVIPSIRKHGGYLTAEKIEEALLDPDTIIKLATNLKEEKKKRKAIQKSLETQKEITRLQEQELAKQAPKVEYHDKVLQSGSTITTTQIAQGLDISAIELNKILKDLGVQYKQSGTWILKGKYKGKGYATTKPHAFYNSKGELQTSQLLVWYESGRKMILELVEDIVKEKLEAKKNRKSKKKK